jgi:hypothetical protein
MKLAYLIPWLFMLTSLETLAGCEEPFGAFISKNGTMNLTIKHDQTVKISNVDEGIEHEVYKGRLVDFDEMKGTELLNYVNAIDVKPIDRWQSHICLHIGEDCSLIKVGICRRSLERFGGEPPKLNSKVVFKND